MANATKHTVTITTSNSVGIYTDVTISVNDVTGGETLISSGGTAIARYEAFTGWTLPDGCTEIVADIAEAC